MRLAYIYANSSETFSFAQPLVCQKQISVTSKTENVYLKLFNFTNENLDVAALENIKIKQKSTENSKRKNTNNYLTKFITKRINIV